MYLEPRQKYKGCVSFVKYLVLLHGRAMAVYVQLATHTFRRIFAYMHVPVSRPEFTESVKRSHLHVERHQTQLRLLTVAWNSTLTCYVS